ncbi:hypothetical protein DL96DRAFT_508557 [Flagelloscypha sp. PMI_526]|nr:hypothetical protein DL96DRAFT_508557 [Flagelloscypha sp. PMI_526]
MPYTNLRPNRRTTTTSLPDSLSYLMSILLTPLSTCPSLSSTQITLLKTSLSHAFLHASRSAPRNQWSVSLTVSASSSIPPPLLLTPCISAGVKWTTWCEALKLPRGDVATFVATSQRVVVLLHSSRCEMVLWAKKPSPSKSSSSSLLNIMEEEEDEEGSPTSSEEEEDLKTPTQNSFDSYFTARGTRKHDSSMHKPEPLPAPLSGGVVLSANRKNGYPRRVRD